MKRKDTRKTTALVTLGIVFAALVALTSTAYAQTPSTGQQLFEMHCGFCHGMFGQGKLAEPNLAGSAGHLEMEGAPLDQVPALLTELVRGGIPGNMPMFPPEVLSDADIPALADYLLSLPPATGTSIYISRCARCHGLSGEGLIGPPLQDTAAFIQAQGWTMDQAAQELGVLVHGGIPGRMPQFPQLTDLEVQRLVVFLVSFDEQAQWEAQFAAVHGHQPAIQDFLDRAWSLEFVSRFGRPPTDEEWQMHWMATHGGPPPGAP